jgi:hypothetical protein
MHEYPFEYQGRNLEVRAKTMWGDFVLEIWEGTECLRPGLFPMTQAEGNPAGAIEDRSIKLVKQVLSGRITIPAPAKESPA